MAGPEIAVLLTANETALLAALARVEAKNKQLEEGFHKTRKAAQPIGDHLKAQLVTITSMVAGYLSLNTAIHLVVGSLREKEELEKKSAQHAIGLAEPQAAFLWQRGAKNQEEQVAALKRVEAIAAATKPKGGIATVYRASTAAMQAAGPEDFEGAMRATETALKFAPQQPEGAIALAGLIPDIAKTTGGGEKENLALILKTKKLAHTKDLESLSSDLLPSIIALGRKGATPEEAVALTTGIQQALPGSSKKAVRGVVNQLIEALEKELPEKDVFKWDERGRKRLVTKGTGLKTPIEQLEYLRKNQEAAEKFMGKAGLGEPAAGITEELLGMGTGQAGKFYQRGLKEPIPDVDQQMALLRKPFEQHAAAIDRLQESEIEELRKGIAGKERTIAGLLSREKRNVLVGEANVPFVERKLIGIEGVTRRELAGQPPEEVEGEITRRLIADLEKPTEWKRVPSEAATRRRKRNFLPGIGKEWAEVPKPAEEMEKGRETADVLKRYLELQLEEARAMRADIQEQKLELQKQTALLQKQQAQPSAAAAQDNVRQHGVPANF